MLPALLLLGSLPALPTPDTTVRLPRGTTVSADAFNHPVRLRGVAGDQVTVTNGTVRLRGTRLQIESNGRGTLEVSVPDWASTTIEALTGGIQVTDAPADLEIDGVAGSVTVAGGSGRLQISAGAGGVTVTGYHGQQVDIEAIAGTVEITDASGLFDISSVNSEVRLDRVRSSAVRASSTNGAILWIGPIPADARYEFESHNGDIRLRVPATLNARLRVRTFMGSFTTDVPARTTGARERSVAPWEGERELVATYGEGSATINVATFNGSIRIQALGGS